MDVREVLRTAREAAGLSQAELARRAGLGQPALSRFETGTRTPSLAVLDRVLAACGLELAGLLVPRHQDLRADLDRLAAVSVAQRLNVLDANPGMLLRPLLEHGCDLLVGGGWAAAAHGLPVGGSRQGLLVLAAGQAASFVAGATTAPRAWRPRRWRDGEPAGWPITEDLFGAGSAHRWSQLGVGEYRTVVLRDGEPGPAEERLPFEEGTLRVVAAAALTPEDGVRPELLEVFLAWRRERWAGAAPT